MQRGRQGGRCRDGECGGGRDGVGLAVVLSCGFASGGWRVGLRDETDGDGVDCLRCLIAMEFRASLAR